MLFGARERIRDFACSLVHEIDFHCRLLEVENDEAVMKSEIVDFQPPTLEDEQRPRVVFVKPPSPTTGNDVIDVVVRDLRDVFQVMLVTGNEDINSVFLAKRDQLGAHRDRARGVPPAGIRRGVSDQDLPISCRPGKRVIEPLQLKLWVVLPHQQGSGVGDEELDRSVALLYLEIVPVLNI